jgi:predicted MFS family arabinose efflux permease
VSPLAYLRGLNPHLPRAVVVLQAGGLVNAFGNGLVVPFLYIYLTDVRGVDRATAGFVLATGGFVALASGPISGAVSERFGAKRTLCGALCVQTVGYASYALVQHPWQGFLAAAVTGVGGGAFWPSQAALIARLTPPDRSHSAWGLQRVMMNTGIGLGGVAGGFLAHGDRPGGYQLIFLLDAATFLGYLCVVVFLPNSRRAEEHRGTSGSYAQVLRNRVLVAVLLTNTVFITAGIAMFELMPAYVKHHAGVTTREIGFIFLANTLFIGLAQLPITQLLEGRRRVPALAALLALGGVAWLAMPLAGRLSGVHAALAVGALAIVFAVAECLHGGVQAPLVVDLAEPRLLERTMALSSSSWQLGFILGPAIGGVVLKHDPSALWLGAGTILVVASAGSLLLERHIPGRARRTPRSAGATDALAAAEARP